MLKKILNILFYSFLVLTLFAESAFAFDSVRFAIREICGHMTGNLGGLLMVVAGIGGLASAAFGNFRASQSLIITAIGAFAISSILSLYFPRAAAECNQNAGDGGGAAGRVVNSSRIVVNSNRNAPGITEQNFFNQDNGFTRNTDAALAIAAGGEADFGNSAPIEQAAGEENFDNEFNEFGEVF